MTYPDVNEVLIGPDVSNVNGKALDPAELVRQRIGFGIYKVGQGLIEDNKAFELSGLDRLARANDAALIAAGLPRCRYFFLEDGDGAEQADRFYKLSGLLGALGSVGHAVDVEVQDKQGRHPSFQTVKDFEARWHAISRLKLGLYSARWFWRGYIGDPPLPPFDWLWDGGTYVSDANSTTDPWQVLQSGGADKEGVTPGYWNPFGGRAHYDLRQYKSTCEVGGVHPCDVSVFPGTREELENLWGIARDSSPTPVSVPVKPIQTPTPATPYPAYPGFPLRRGNARVAAVATWQARMRKRGWQIAVDGVFGPQTEQVCRQFQTEKHLAVDGIVGPVTWAAAWTSPVT